ncbi:MAG TPA: DUF2062 domain-containing protein [Chthoniobacterales bacterium]
MRPIEWRRTRVGRYLRHLPRPKHLRGSWLHRKLGDSLLARDLWHPDPSRVAAGFSLGAFFAVMPIPFQSIPAALLAFLTRSNIAAALCAVWITNPFTAPFFIYAQYRIGAWILRDPNPIRFQFQQAIDWNQFFSEAPKAFLAGSVAVGLISAAVVYPIVLVAWKGLALWVRSAHRKHPSAGTGDD